MRSRSRSPDPVCPSCGRSAGPGDIFCPSCEMPLGGEPLETPVSDAHGRARKINPVYADGALVRVAGGRNQAEAELIQGLLLEEGVPSMVRRSAGFDVPDYLAGGPRDVMVPQAGAEAAREILLQSELIGPPTEGFRPSAVKVTIAIVGGGTVAAVLAWLLQSG